MLSRSAQGLYWLGRYLERAEHLCRLLQMQTEALVDRPVQEIYYGWSRIYRCLGVQPTGGLFDPEGDDDYTLADSYTLADELTFERSNPASIWSCFALGRENARQMRHRISAEMWTSLNVPYLRLRGMSIQNIWVTSPESFYAQTAADVNTFNGVAGATMYRDEGWRFLQLGQFVERSQTTSSLLLAQMGIDAPEMENTYAGWNGLLRIYHASEIYVSNYGVDVQPGRVLDLLATDPLLPNSLGRSIDKVSEEIGHLAAGPDRASNGAARRLTGRMRAMVHYDWPDVDDHRGLLERVRVYCRDLHNLLVTAYFDYPIRDWPAR